jgi:DNA-binding NtrC family response regulator
MNSVPRLFPGLVQSLDGQQPLLYREAPEMIHMMDQVQLIAPQSTTVLLSGETGTGKSRLARLIHDLSPRSALPFRAVNCGALAANLIESELFGHVRGAFTGAVRDRDGRFTEVGSGTLMLDDIDGLPPAVQVKLLRAVEERVFEPVGANTSQALDARLIVASTRDLNAEVAAGRFRADLYYRLNVIEFHLPPLRERRSIIAPLAREFLAEFAAQNGRPVCQLASAARQALELYDWPGNIRELRHVIERAVALCAGQDVQVDDLPDHLCQTQGGAAKELGCCSANSAPSFNPVRLIQLAEAAEAAYITEALRRHRQNRVRVAAELGISQVTLYRKLHKYGLVGMPRLACPRETLAQNSLSAQGASCVRG